MTPAGEALVQAYGLDALEAERWVSGRRAVLLARSEPSADTHLAASSGCAASGARSHSQEVADDALHALARLDAGLVGHCEQCSQPIPWERLDAAPLAARCVTCARPSTLDTRWCR